MIRMHLDWLNKGEGSKRPARETINSSDKNDRYMSQLWKCFGGDSCYQGTEAEMVVKVGWLR